jgi:hypothetical protein
MAHNPEIAGPAHAAAAKGIARSIRCTRLGPDHLCMGSYGGVYVGGVQVASIKNRVYPELLSVFTDSMYRSRIAEATEFYVDTEPGATVTAHEFTAPAHVIVDRLDILGFTPDKVYCALDSQLNKARDMYALPFCDDVDPEYQTRTEARWAYLSDYTAQDWIADLRSAAADPAMESMEPGTIRWLMSHIDNEDERLALRAALLARPDDEVRLDVTDLVAGGLARRLPGGNLRNRPQRHARCCRHPRADRGSPGRQVRYRGA